MGVELYSMGKLPIPWFPIRILDHQTAWETALGKLSLKEFLDLKLLPAS